MIPLIRRFAALPVSIVVFLAVYLAGSLPSHATEIWETLRPLGSARVVDVVDGDTVIVEPALDGKPEVRLVGLQAPKLALGRKNFKAWPLAPESRDALARLTLGETVSLFAGGAATDRHGRHLAHLRLADGRWVQGEMLRAGWARVYSFPDNRSLTAEMLTLEREARTAGKGIWAHPNYAVRRPDGLADLIGRFELVEGDVFAAEIRKGTGYINFGADWRTDFTLVVRRPWLKTFADKRIDIAGLAGKRLRVRGWLKSYNGPSIEITHPEQIEILP